MVASLENCSFLAFYKPLSVFFIEKEGFRAAYHHRVTKPCSTDLGRCRTTAVPYTVDLVDLTIFKFDFSGSSRSIRLMGNIDFHIYLAPFFFHPYTFLVFVNSGLFLLFNKSLGFSKITDADRRKNVRTIGGLAISAGIVLFFFFTWFFYQQPNSDLNFELFRYTGSFLNFLLSGTGWRGYEWCANSTLFGPWEFFLSITFAIGILLTTMDKKLLKLIFPIILAYILQTSLIVAADYLRGYWVALRQIIHLTPMLFIVNASMTCKLIEWISSRQPKQGKKGFSRATLLILSTLIIITFATPKILEYYDVGKSNAREIVESMRNSRPEVHQILVYPGYDSIVYELYLGKYFEIKDTKVVRTDLNNLSEYTGQDHFLISPVQLTEEEIRNINQYYTLVYLPETRCFGDRGLYISK